MAEIGCWGILSKTSFFIIDDPSIPNILKTNLVGLEIPPIEYVTAARDNVTFQSNIILGNIQTSMSFLFYNYFLCFDTMRKILSVRI